MPPHRIIHPRIGHSQKIAILSDRAFRTWTTYLWVADDFGVMPFDAAKIQGGNRRLAECPRRTVQSDLGSIVAVGLVLRYDVAGEPYICSPTWQTHQNVKWPRVTETHWPPPPTDVLQQCDRATQELFRKHPGYGGGEPALLEVPRSTSQNFEVPRSTSKLTRAGTRDAGTRETLTPNANALANAGVRSGEGLPLDVWLRELQERYPQQAVSSGYLTESAFLDAIGDDGRDPAVVFDEMLAHLDNQLRGYQWRVKRMIPRLVNWLREGLWRQLHDEQPPTALVDERTLHTAIAADAFVKGGPHGTH